MQFINFSLERLVKNLSDNNFKYFTEEFGSTNLELLKRKDAYLYEYMGSFKRFGEERLSDRECFYNSLKDGTTGDNGENVHGYMVIDACLKFYGLDTCHYFSSPGIS